MFKFWVRFGIDEFTSKEEAIRLYNYVQNGDEISPPKGSVYDIGLNYLKRWRVTAEGGLEVMWVLNW